MTADLTGFRLYAEARGYAAPMLATDEAANAALVRATDYIMTEYVARFVPPIDATAPNVDPAIYEAALSELTAEGELRPSSFWTPVDTPADRKMLVEVDGIKWEPIPGNQTGAGPFSRRIDRMLRPYIGGSGLRKVVRA